VPLSREQLEYFRRQNVKQRRSRIPLTDRTVGPTLGVAANLDLPAVRIDAPLDSVQVQRAKNTGGQIDLMVGGVLRTTIGAGRTAAGNLAAGDLVNLRIVNGFVGVEEIRFFLGGHNNEIARTKINASA